MKGYFAQVRRAGFDIGLSVGKLTKAMVDVLSHLPLEAAPSKEVVVQHLGLLGQMSKIRGVNAAWSSAKRQVVREHPGKVLLRRQGIAFGIGHERSPTREALERRPSQTRRPRCEGRHDAGCASPLLDLVLAP
jgi:hypothetical protein